jgi:hypothetical protein
LAAGLTAGFEADLGGDAEGREGREEDEVEPAEAQGWLFKAVAVGFKSEVLWLRLRFICRSPNIIEEPTVCTVMAPA